MPEPINLSLQFNPNGVVGPALQTMRRASEAVRLMLGALDAPPQNAADQAEPKAGGAFFKLRFDVQPPEYDRRADLTQWVLEQAFRDLAKGVRESLEEAFLYITLAVDPPTTTTWGEFQDRLAAVRATANGLKFPPLLEAVNKGLKEPLRFEDAYQSIQNVRNCIEHRGSKVGRKDVNHAQGMRLALPRLRLVYATDDGLVEIVGGEYFAQETTLSMQLHIRERFFAEGSLVTFSAEEFDEIASACQFFANDLGGKLPPVVGAPSPDEVTPKLPQGSPQSGQNSLQG